MTPDRPRTDTTDATGAYTLTLPPGDYIVCEELQTGWTQTFPTGDPAECDEVTAAPPLGAHGYAITLTSGEAEVANDFGNQPQDATKSGIKFEDVNGNGDQDAGDDPLSGWVINAYADDGDGLLGGAEYAAGTAATDTTDASGAYSLTLPPGDYIVCEELQAGWTQTAPVSSDNVCSESTADPDLGDQGYAIDLGPGEQDTGNDFGNQQQPATKSGIKFHDRNGNGTKDGDGEELLSGWTINVYADDEEANGHLDLAEADDGPDFTQDTDASGAYSFTLPPGAYIVCEVLQNGWTQTAPVSSDNICSESSVPELGDQGYAIDLDAGEQDTGNDFGNQQQATKSGVKFRDLNGDGIKDAGEPLLEDWTINVYARRRERQRPPRPRAEADDGPDFTQAHRRRRRLQLHPAARRNTSSARC